MCNMCKTWVWVKANHYLVGAFVVVIVVLLSMVF